MRSSKSRSRSKNNRNRNSLGNVVNRVFDSSGPEGKVRGTPQQIIDKYNQLARDAALGNDRVAAENFQQHAEHYMRLLSEAQREQDQRREQQERENRERQAQRDRERAQRDTSDADKADKPDRSEKQEKTARPDPAPQPEAAAPSMSADVVDLGGSDDDGPGLVETPESRAEVQPTLPGTIAEPAAETPAEAAAPEAPSEAKPADSADKPAEKPKKPRAPRKPRKKPEPKVAEAAPDAAAPADSTPPAPDAAE
ncbi:DUF4167 domain-containing protein [Mameliella alba]|nr:DUF4167 domain-containing protein [Antarctobacter heliothermus]MBY6145672.1 DUF4167 domain-containing protein [Mameliella alba]MBY6160995.1 DUF4167 domain-containing protein [Mameliella alba]MBY6169465.1 DUF4167 domain-containing protein [Mameliella alba]MBY6174484.1 DUF4167 domain-containing protein [Mameliella alba]